MKVPALFQLIACITWLIEALVKSVDAATLMCFDAMSTNQSRVSFNVRMGIQDDLDYPSGYSGGTDLSAGIDVLVRDKKSLP